jgi:hypothetical protein
MQHLIATLGILYVLTAFTVLGFALHAEYPNPRARFRTYLIIIGLTPLYPFIALYAAFQKEEEL